MKTEAEGKAALKRTDAAMWQLLAAIAIGLVLSCFVEWLTAAVIGLVLAAVPLSRWFVVEFSAWDQGGPAGEAHRSSEDAKPNA